MTDPIGSFSGEYRWLSNFHPCVLPAWHIHTSLGEYTATPPTVEHAYQAAKFPHMPEHMLEVLRAPTAGRAKRLGQAHPPAPEWEQPVNNDPAFTPKMQAMSMYVNAKFDALLNPELNARLLQTGQRQLIEGNEWGDRFWGQVDGVGENHLGKLIMTVRAYWSYYVRNG